jgi:hypothetical protein
MQSEQKQLAWFRRSGILYVPNSPMGWYLLCAAAGYLVYAFVAIDSESHSASDTLMNWAFNAVIICGALYVVAWLTTLKQKRST